MMDGGRIAGLEAGQAGQEAGQAGREAANRRSHLIMATAGTVGPRAGRSKTLQTEGEHNCVGMSRIAL
jgi:hypothetical protein